MGYTLSAACGSNTGKRRMRNEDNFYFDGQYLQEKNSGTGQNLTCSAATADHAVNFAVFDGMGGHADGNTASHLAATVFAEDMKRGGESHESVLAGAVLNMSSAVAEKADAEFNNMGTTAAIMRFAGNSFYLANVGDSRIFLYRGGELRQISHDHTDEELLRKLGVKGRKPQLTQYVGISPEEMTVQPYQIRGDIAQGDLFLLCSDGLTDMVSEEEIASVLSRQADVSWKTDELIRQAIDHGGKDNVTVILVQVMGEASGKAAPAAKGGSALKIGLAAAAAAVLIIAGVLVFTLGRGKEENAEEAATVYDTAEEEAESDIGEDADSSGIQMDSSGINLKGNGKDGGISSEDHSVEK